MTLHFGDSNWLFNIFWKPFLVYLQFGFPRLWNHIFGWWSPWILCCLWLQFCCFWGGIMYLSNAEELCCSSFRSVVLLLVEPYVYSVSSIIFDILFILLISFVDIASYPNVSCGMLLLRLISSWIDTSLIDYLYYTYIIIYSCGGLPSMFRLGRYCISYHISVLRVCAFHSTLHEYIKKEVRKEIRKKYTKEWI